MRDGFGRAGSKRGMRASRNILAEKKKQIPGILNALPANLILRSASWHGRRQSSDQTRQAVTNCPATALAIAVVGPHQNAGPNIESPNLQSLFKTHPAASEEIDEAWCGRFHAVISTA
jgi:hypothetical protein